jgi:hypothetical protein
MPYLECDGYKTKTFYNEISSKLVESEEPGVHLIDNEYVYRGEVVNNYLKMGSNVWRIIKVTDDGYLKLIKEKKETAKYIWDDRYNIVENKSIGINDFEKSRIKESLSELYNQYETNSNIKKYAVPREVCIYNKSEADAAFISDTTCDAIGSKRYIGFITPNDIVYGSIDPNCKKITDQSCYNYNYFSMFYSSSWSSVLVKGSTSKVYYYSLGSAAPTNANATKNLQLVIYISADNLIKDGDGSQQNPYQI